MATSIGAGSRLRVGAGSWLHWSTRFWFFLKSTAPTMNSAHISLLLENLHSPDELVRDRATQALWQLWFEQKGLIGLRRLRQAQTLIEAGDFGRAEVAFETLLEDEPDFAEAWNRRAVMYFIQRDFPRAIGDCRMAVKLVPYHFGAWHGLGLCYLSLEQYREAIAAFTRALEIQPYSVENKRLLLECNLQMQ
jgi:tetratricopeptide (TPR) repeat protein